MNIALLRSCFVLLLSVGFSLATLCAQPLRVGIIKYKTTRAVEETYRPLLEYVTKELGRPLELEILTDESLGYGLDRNEFDLGIFTPFPYLEAKIDFPALEVFASHTVAGANSYMGGIIVRKQSGINNLDDFQEKHFSFVKETSTSGFKYPQGIFNEYGLNIDSTLKKYVFSGGHVPAVTALLSGKTDGIAIDLDGLNSFTREEQNMLKVLKSYEVPYHAYVFSPNLPEEVRQQLRDIMFEAHKNPTAKPLFRNSLEIEGWHAASDDTYNPLRRYLGMSRVKPDLQLKLVLRETAEEELKEEGDVIPVLKEKLVEVLENTNRFTLVSLQGNKAAIPLELRISMIGDAYHFLLYLQDKRIAEGDLSLKELRQDLPGRLAISVLENLPIQAELLRSGDRWFTTYGTNDGLSAEAYDFVIDLPDDKAITLGEADILEMTSINTSFLPKAAFVDHQPLRIVYRDGPDARSFVGPTAQLSNEEEGFWSKLDNIWGMIGLLVAFITIGLGSYFSGRKKKRFRSMLYESNYLLREYIEGKTRIDNKILLQQEKINESLEKGYINENQFLILKHRLEDIDRVIADYLLRQEPLPGDVSTEIAEILQSEVITEREFTRILSLVKKAEGG